jgi:cytochrome oxidase Cu insertion factor (SCO1/SenC/PrrC family)
MKNVLIWTAAAVALAAAGLFTYMQLVKHAIIKYNKFDKRQDVALSVGQPAPDVALTMYDGTPMRLSKLWQERPLFLVFGSCT